jgi:prolipoprotein diacylglyceryltransferase
LVPPVFPTPVYETIMCLVLFGILWALRKRLTVPGLMITLYVIMNGVERFLIEKIRVNTKYHIAGLEITQAEIISAVFIVGGLVALYLLLRRHRRKAHAAPTG